MLKFSGEVFSQAEIEVNFPNNSFNALKGWPTYQQEIIDGADLDGDGRIDYSEFAELMVHSANWYAESLVSKMVNFL